MTAPFQPILLRRHVPGADVQRQFEALSSLIPRHAMWACWTFGKGPWNDFIHRPVTGTITFADASGQRVTESFNAARQSGSWRLDLCEALSLTLTVLVAQDDFPPIPAMGFLLREHALIVMVHKASSQQPSFYIPSPFAAGHDLLDDPARLEREWPGRFAIEGAS